MKKRLITKILAYTLASALMIGAMPLNTYAAEFDEDDWEYEDVPEEDDPVPAPDPTPDPIHTEEYDYLSITGGNTRISFGSVSKGSYTDYQVVTFTNRGTETHCLSMLTSDDSLWDMIIPYEAFINPGQSLDVYVRPRTESGSIGKGEYSGNLTINGWSCDGWDITSTINVNLSVNIYEEKKPWVRSVTVYPEQVAVGKGTSYSFFADVDAGDGALTTVSWSISGQTSPSTSITPNGTLNIGADESASQINITAVSDQDKSVRGSAVATINKSQYTIATQANPSNGGTTVGGGSFTEGTQATIIANPSNGYGFSGWYDQNNNKISDLQSYTFTVKSSQTLTARFSQNSVRINTKKNINEGGTITDSATLMYGGSYTINATAAQNYRFVGWYEGNNLVTNSASYTMSGITGNRELTAVFERTGYNILVSCNPQAGGTVEGAGSVKAKANATLTAKPAKGYDFAGWIYNNNIINTDKTITVKNVEQDYSLVAYFVKASAKLYTIGSATDTANGTITPSGNVNVEEGKSMVYTITPNKDYMIADVKVDGKSVGPVTSYIFNNVDKAHTITASFTKIPAAQTPSGTNGTIPSTTPQTTPQTKVDVVDDTNKKITTTAPTVDDVYAADSPVVTALPGSLQDANVTPEEAEVSIEQGNDRYLMETALYRGDLEVTVRNHFAPIANETATTSYYEITSIPNFEDVMDSVLTNEQKMELFEGSKVRANLNIVGVDDEVSAEDVQVINQKVSGEVNVASYFDIRFILEVKGVPELVTDINEPMKVVMHVPDSMKMSSAPYCVVRLHNGQVDILPDEDNSPDTVTFSTDKMSVFALGQYNAPATETIENKTLTQDNTQSEVNKKSNNTNDNVNVVIYIMTAVIALGLITIAAVAITGNKKKRHHHKNKKR